ncbi:MAG: hypothetical protein GY940_00490, partial [bacterium]|nr:hypothetical protein [bacterium]
MYIKKNIKKIYPVLLVFLIITLGVLPAAQSLDSFETGKVIEKVICLRDDNESYTLYLPTAYNKKEKWPLLMAFEPAARAMIPINLFKTAAETYNYIVVCPINAKNGPRRIAANAAAAVWNDVNTRFSIDRQRVYATGFSGGSRVSSFLHLVIQNPVRGIIGCGAGLSSAIKPEQLKNTHYLGIVGYADFNYREMVRLEKTLSGQGTPLRFIYYNSKHRWPPESIATRAIEWMELMALKDGLIPKDHRQDFIDAMFEKELKLVKEREQAGEIFHSAGDCDALARVFDGLKPTESFKQGAARLKSLKEYKKFQKAELKRLEDESIYMRKFFGVFDFLKKSDPRSVSLGKVMSSMDIRRLDRVAGSEKNIYDSGMAERVLYSLTNKARQEGATYMKAGDFKRASFFWEIASASGKHSFFYPWMLYNLASVHAVQGKKKKALNALKEAIENGFKNIDAIK